MPDFVPTLWFQGEEVTQIPAFSFPALIRHCQGSGDPEEFWLNEVLTLSWLYFSLIIPGLAPLQYTVEVKSKYCREKGHQAHLHVGNVCERISLGQRFPNCESWLLWGVVETGQGSHGILTNHLPLFTRYGIVALMGSHN